jgi:hypothetical protein
MFIATGTDASGKLKVVLRAKKDLLMIEWSDGQSHFYSGPHLSYMRMELEKETGKEKIHFNTGRPTPEIFPVGTFHSLATEVYGFEYEKLVPDTNITVSAFEKMQKEAADMKKEIDRLKSAPASTKRSTKPKVTTVEVDLLNIA